MTERMNEEAQATLLEILQGRLAEHHRAGEGGTLELTREDFEQFGTVLGWNAREVSALYKPLVRERFVRQVRREMQFVERRDGVLDYAWGRRPNRRGHEGDRGAA